MTVAVVEAEESAWMVAGIGREDRLGLPAVDIPAVESNLVVEEEAAEEKNQE